MNGLSSTKFDRTLIGSGAEMDNNHGASDVIFQVSNHDMKMVSLVSSASTELIADLVSLLRSSLAGSPI